MTAHEDFLSYLDELEARQALELFIRCVRLNPHIPADDQSWPQILKAYQLATAEPLCPRCMKAGPDAFGPQLEGGWHEGCAADVAHEGKRDHDPHYHRSDG